MLDAVGAARSPIERVNDLVAGHDPTDLLPREFRIRDACITNMPTLWLGKHFYL